MSAHAKIEAVAVASRASLRFLSPRHHGLIDYAAAGALVVLPYLLGLGDSNPTQLLLSVAAGLGLATYSVLTDYQYALAGAVSFTGHLVLDALAGVTFVAAPFVLGFDALATVYYVASGLAVLTVVAVSNPGLAET